MTSCLYSAKNVQEVEDLGSSCTVIVCKLWYEYSLTICPVWFGFDFVQMKLVLQESGDTKVNATTWEQCGRAIAGLVCLKERPEDEADANPTVCDFNGKPLSILSSLILKMACLIVAKVR